MNEITFKNLVDSKSGEPITIDIGERDPSEFEKFSEAGKNAVVSLKRMFAEDYYEERYSN